MQNSKANEQLLSVLLLKFLGTNLHKKTKGKKNRRSFTPHEILYQMYLYTKNVKRGAWDSIFVNKQTISKHSGVGITAITEFITSHDCEMFLDIQRSRRNDDGRFSSNTYRLKKDFIEIFQFLELKGFFKNFKEDLPKWKDWFDKRLEKYIIPNLENGRCLHQIMNNLSTKTQVKTATANPVKTASTTPPGFSYDSKELDKVQKNCSDIQRTKERRAFEELEGINLTFREKERLSLTFSILSLREARKDLIFYSRTHKVKNYSAFIYSRARDHQIEILTRNF